MTKVFGETRVVEPLVWVSVWVRCWDINGGTNEARDVGDGLLEVVVVVRILMRPLANLADRIRVIGASVKVAIPVRSVGANGWRHLQTVLRKVELANHLRS